MIKDLIEAVDTLETLSKEEIRRLEREHKRKLEKDTRKKQSVDLIGVTLEGDYIFKIDDWELIHYEVVELGTYEQL